jgi:hypothetical protein
MTNQEKMASAPNSSAGLPLKLAGLFAVSFVLFFMAFMAYDVLSGFNRNTTVAVQVNEEIKPDVDIPKIADDLAKVLATNEQPYAQEVKDPFFDRAGLSNASTVSFSSNVPATTTASKSVITSVPKTTTVVSGNSGKGMANPGGSGSVYVPMDATKERYENWLSRSINAGDTTLDPRVFAIEDLTPVGVVDGGNGQQEVMFFSQAAGKTVSFPVGTMFFDGWLTELRPEGVVFSSNDDRRIIRMRSWARSLKNLG